ncbi:MAG: sulfatase [Myxococcota bacterium]
MILLVAACADPPREGPPNLVLVSIDGFRGDHAGHAGNPNAPTPTLDRLASEGQRFTRAFSQSNESLFSHASLLTGRYVSEVAAPDYRTMTVPDGTQLVGEVLKVYGYDTAAFVAGGHVRSAYGFAQGFDVYRDDHDFGAFFHTVPEALAWLDAREGDAPFFLFLHGYDCHRPYVHGGVFEHVYGADYTGEVDALLRKRTSTEQVYRGRFYPDFSLLKFEHHAGDPIIDPEGYLRIASYAGEGHEGVALTDADFRHLRDHYDGGALAADLQIGRFVNGLRDRGLLDDTLMVLTADHGEDLHDHGYLNHRAVLRDSTTHVPLVIRGPGVAPGVREDLAEAIDVVPTLLAAAGAEPPAGLRGRDLLGDAPAATMVVQEGVLPHLSARTATHRLVFVGVPLAFPLFDLALKSAPVEPPWFELYDLAADPGETHNVVTQQVEQAKALRDALVAWRGAVPRSAWRGQQPQDPALREILRARGYW